MRKRNRERAYPPLVRTVQRRVRFEEVDQISYMWHGHYASWLEDGREDLGAYFHISYLDFYHCGVSVPLKTLLFDFKIPLRYNNIYTIETSLLWNEAAVLEYTYRILDAEQHCMTMASTTQLMLDAEGKLLLDSPHFYKKFCEQWAQGLVR